MKFLFAFAFFIALLPQMALADVGPPVHMQITESEPDLYSAQWRVPKVLLPRAVPSPQLPETCLTDNEVTVLTQPGAWLFRQEWVCETTLAGHEVGMYYPFPDLALTTVIRADLLSGDRFAHVLSPGDGPVLDWVAWTVWTCPHRELIGIDEKGDDPQPHIRPGLDEMLQ